MYTSLIMNICALITLSYAALKIKNRIEPIEGIILPLLTGLASLIMIILPGPSFLLVNLCFAPIIIVGLRYGPWTAFLSTIIPVTFSVLLSLPDWDKEIAYGILLPAILSSLIFKKETRNNSVPLRYMDGLSITIILVVVRLLGIHYSRTVQPEHWVNSYAATLIITVGTVALIIAMYNDEYRNNLRRQLLELQANQDSLTRLPNLHSFMNMANNAIQHHLISIFMIDIDNFKRYNDSLGHLMGDDLLREVGGILQQEIGEGDYVARYGGEEFIVLCHEDSQEQLAAVAGRLCEAVSRHTFTTCLESEGNHITISIGISTSRSLDDNLKNVIGEADQAMYSSKKSGKNRFTFYNSSYNRTSGRA